MSYSDQPDSAPADGLPLDHADAAHPTPPQLWLLLLIFVAALALRLIIMVQGSASPLFSVPTVDTRVHAQWIERIAAGELSPGRSFFRAPLYAYVMALVYQLSGQSFWWVKCFQHILGAASCVLLYLLGTRLLGRPAALLAAFGAVCYGPLIYLENELLLPSLLVFLFLAALLQLYEAVYRPSALRWFVGGLLWGLAACARPNFLLIVPVILVWWIWTTHSDRLLRRRLLDGVLLVAGVVLCILPVTLHNRLIGQDWVLLASQGGINFYIGNSAYADGKTAFAVGSSLQYSDEVVDNVYKDSVSAAVEALQTPLRDSQVSRFWFRKGLEYWQQAPLAAAGLTCKKLYFLVNGFEIEGNRSMYLDRDTSALFALLTWVRGVAFPLGLLWPLALVGLCLPLKDVRFGRLLKVILLTYGASIVLFFVIARFRIPVVPLLLIFAASALSQLVQDVRTRHFRRAGLQVGAIIVLCVLSNSGFWQVREIRKARQLTLQAFAHREVGDLAGAADLYEQALALEPDSFRTHFFLGTVHEQAGDLQAAVARYSATLDLAPDHVDALLALGRVTHFLGRNEQALVPLRRVLELHPDQAVAYPLLAMALRLGDLPGARQVLEQVVELEPEVAGHHHLLGLIALEAGHLDQALMSFERSVQLEPEHAQSHLRTGIILDQRGKRAAARRAFERALAADSACVEAYFWLGTLLCENGEYDLGIRLLSEALRHEPDYAQAQHNLAVALDHIGQAARAWEHLQRAKALGQQVDAALEQRLQAALAP